MIHFKKLDLLTATTEDWKHFHTFRKAFQKEEFPDIPVDTDKAKEISRRGFITNTRVQYTYILIFNDNKVIGGVYYFYFTPASASYKGNEKVVHFGIELLRAYRRQGIGRQMLQLMVDDCEKADKSLFINETSVFESKGFYEAIGGKIAQFHAENKLNLSEIDVSMLINWIKEAEGKNPDSLLVIIEDALPDEYAQQFVIAFNASGNDAPRDDVEIGDEVLTVEQLRLEEKTNKQAGTKVLTGLVIEQDGAVSALTQMKIFAGREKLLGQSLTGVPTQFRGRKLGKWVKASMLLYVKEHYPDAEAIITGNADSNGPMLHINTKLGFKRFLETFVGQVTLEQLKTYLKSKELFVQPVS